MVPLKTASRKVRGNRFKRDVAGLRRRWWSRLRVGLKLMAMMLVLLGASALFMVVYAAVTSSDYFRTQTIAVMGNQRLSTDTVLEQAGIRYGENLLALNLRLVRERLIAHPWIEEARVTRDIPDTIAIRVAENVPLARVDLGRHFLINSEGRIFKEVEGDESNDLPLISGVVYRDIRLGTDALGPAMGAVVRVLRISRTEQGCLAYAAIERLHLDGETGVTLTLKGRQRTIHMGVGDYEAKFERFRRLNLLLMQNDQWRDYVAVDLNNPDRVVVQLSASR